MRLPGPMLGSAAPWPALATAAVLLLLAACRGGGGTAPPAASACTAAPDETPSSAPEGDLFANPGFEQGGEPWFSLTESWGTMFAVSQQAAHTGASSAYLRLSSEDGESTRVYGVVQEIDPAQFPEVLSGYYCVERWQQGTPKQYLQFVVIVFQAQNIPAELAQAGASNHQIRYLLAGVDSEPTTIKNARYVFISRDPPQVGQWVRFQRDIRQDFQELWGDVPAGYANLRFFFEARWDERSPSDGASTADVYYDDLYVGPAPGS